MSTTKKVFTSLKLLVAAIVLIVIGGCTEEESPVKKTEYNLVGKDVLGVTGKVTITETTSTSVTIDIALIGAPSGNHPAKLCMLSIIEDGPSELILNSVDASGHSSTYVSTMTYDQLVAYDGSIKVLKSIIEPHVILAQCDIGGNIITTTNKTYPLVSVGTYGVVGNALFEKRTNGNTLVTITLTGIISGESYPATINLGSIASVGGGPVVKTLTNVDGNVGTGYTNIRTLNSGIDITFDDWMVYDGYINIYQTSVSSGTIICHGDLGSN
jgi:hypothetical protein